MRLKVDRKADALYLRLDDSPILESEEVSPGVPYYFQGPVFRRMSAEHMTRVCRYGDGGQQ